MNDRQEVLEKARSYAFLLLKFRLRSESELLCRLRLKKFDIDIARETVAFLKEKGFIDDKVFAKTWIASRLKRPLGLARIRHELRIKGVKEPLIDDEIRAARKDYPEEEIVSSLAKARFSRCKDAIPAIAKRRVVAYLLRRGFPPELVTEVVDRF